MDNEYQIITRNHQTQNMRAGISRLKEYIGKQIWSMQKAMPDLTELLQEAASKPAEVRTEEATVKAHPLPDLIEVHRYLQGIKSTSAPHLPFRITYAVPPGPQ